MGWGLYDDASGEVQNAEAYWKAQDEAARKYASFFYVRWRWSDMEPEEGKYAWKYDDNFKKLIQGALDRGLKLSFRVYDNGQDNLRPGTPAFVRQAGANGYNVRSGKINHWTPFPDDSIFQEKWSNFVEAFAAEFDNPDIVDFVDGFSIGAWGEAHSIRLMDSSKLPKLFEWYTSLYSQNFKKVLIALPFNGQVGFDVEKEIAIDKKGYTMRRDGLGSEWFTPYEKRIAKRIFGKTLLIGESCYWGCSTADKNCRPFDKDRVYTFNSWKDVYELTYKDALQYGFNTLDLREIPETKGWTTLAPHLVQGFIEQGGYRLYPSKVTMPKVINSNQEIIIKHTWRNMGTGYLPNNNPKWNYKYKPAFALIDQNGEVVKYWVDESAEPSLWVKQRQEYSYSLAVNATHIPKGDYIFAVAIIDRNKDDKPSINLALTNHKVDNGWCIISEIEIK